jgi:hypothetical protein
MQKVFSLNFEENRQARALLDRLARDGFELVRSGELPTVQLLEQHGMAVLFNGRVTITPDGLRESPLS